MPPMPRPIPIPIPMPIPSPTPSPRPWHDRTRRRARLRTTSHSRYSTPVRGYLVKEMFGPTLQGEGAHAGRPCVFLRFAACNLACTWCDTDFRPEGATRHDADEIAARLVQLDAHQARMVVATGGRPTLQADATR